MFNSIKNAIPPLHKEGQIFVIIFAVITFVLFSFSDIVGWIGVILTVWCFYFFRDPERMVPQGDGIIVSPGDGIVCNVVEASPPKELEMGEKKYTRISIFLNVFNVHVNRIPIAGNISKLHYHAGKFLNAELDKASEDNERQAVLLTTDNGQEIAFTQIAGLVARRIVCDLEVGQKVVTGERFGIIRFGSRVDVYIPSDIPPLVSVGQTAIGGETILANLEQKDAKHEAIKL